MVRGVVIYLFAYLFCLHGIFLCFSSCLNPWHGIFKLQWMEVSSVTIPPLDQSVVKGEAYHILPGVNPNCPSFLLFLLLAHMLSS